jgi:hypothetical protein
MLQSQVCSQQESQSPWRQSMQTDHRLRFIGFPSARFPFPRAGRWFRFGLRPVVKEGIFSPASHPKLEAGRKN